MKPLKSDEDANLDSDSDSDSTSNCSQSQYILGFDDGKIKKNSDLLQFNISRIGGTPVFLPLNHTIIPQSDLNCLNCQKPLPLLLQIYCVSLQNPSHDRVLYIFGCPDEACQSQSLSKSVRGFKSWKFNQEYHQQSSQSDNQPEPELGENPFKINNAPNLFELCFENPFATGQVTSTIPESNSLDHSISRLTLTTPTSVETINSSVIASLPTLFSPPHYLNTGYEVKPKPAALGDPTFKEFEEQAISLLSKNIERQTLAEISKKQGSGHTSSYYLQAKNQDEESYEVQSVKGVDPAFLDFQDRTNWNNQSNQIVRYNPNGRPLSVNSILPSPSISALKCGHESKFELQLMPASLRFFSNSFNWTTVWLNDCIYDCPGTDEGWVEVQCFVQCVD